MRRMLMGAAAGFAALAMVPLTGAEAEGCGVPDDSLYKGTPYNGGTYPVGGTGQAGDGTIYLDDRDFLTGNGLWIYQESNTTNWLQRGGSTIDGDPSGVDACVESDFPDQVLF